MRRGNKSRSRSVAKKSPASRPLNFAAPLKRIRPGVDYTRLTHEEIRRQGQLRLDRWKQPDFMEDTPLLTIQKNIAQARRSGQVFAPPVNVNQSTPRSGARVTVNTSVAASTLSRVSPSAVPTLKKKGTTLECLGRKLRRQFVFAAGGGGIRRRIMKQRASPSKEKC